MSELAQLEARLLNAAELEIVNETRPPTIEQLSVEQLKVLAQRLRRARDRAEDIAAQQKREMRGKAHPRGTTPARDNTGTLAKAQVWGRLRNASSRNCRREELTSAATTQADLSRHALELKLSHPAPPHPGAGRSASKRDGTQREAETAQGRGIEGRGGPRVTEGKVAQARQDSGDR